MSKHAALPEVLQLVLDLASLLSDLPSLLVDRVTEEAVDLDNCLHNELAPNHNIEGCWLLPNVIDSSALCKLQFLREAVEIDEVDTIPS